jgi:hypothetical protein
VVLLVLLEAGEPQSESDQAADREGVAELLIASPTSLAL